jgi:flap endonuclease-1
MTIKGLWEFYKDFVGYGKIDVRKLKGKLVAVDSFGIMYKTRSVSKKSYLYKINPFSTKVDDDAIDLDWLSRALNLIMEYILHGFIPVLVYDGAKSPLKKKKCEDRAKVGKKAEEEIAKLIAANSDIDPLLVSMKDINEYRKLLTQTNKMPQSSIQLFKQFFKDIGIPWVNAKGEGERTCALLNNQGICSAIISNDGDCFAYGGNLVLLEKTDIFDDNGFGFVGYTTAELESLLNGVEMEFDLFQELCIMAGTDFNENIHRVSFKNSIKLLHKHGSIKSVGKHSKYDVSILNHEEVLKEFSIVPWEETVTDYCLSLTIDEKRDTDALIKQGLERHAKELERLKLRILPDKL